MTRSDRRAVVAICCIAIIALGVLIVTDAIRGKEAADDKARQETIAKTARELQRRESDNFHLQKRSKRWTNYNDSLHRRRNNYSNRRDYSNRGYGQQGEGKYAENQGTGKGADKRAYKGTYHGMDNEKPVANKFTSITKIDINTADSATLCRIPGVGAKTAHWIVAHRKRLGGYHSIRQLLDIPIVGEDLLEWFFVGKQPDIQQISINTASFRQLNMHPCISYEQAKSLSNHIRLYGAIADSASLRSTGIFSDEQLAKLLPYIKFD